MRNGICLIHYPIHLFVSHFKLVTSMTAMPENVPQSDHNQTANRFTSFSRPAQEDASPEFDNLLSAVSTGLDRPLDAYDDPEEALANRIDALMPKPAPEPGTVASAHETAGDMVQDLKSMEKMFSTLPTTAEELDAINYDEPLPEDYDTRDSDAPEAVAMRAHPAIADKYHIVRELGRGAQGTTWLARFKTRERYVAIKALGFNELANWKSTELFMREIETLKSMRIEGTPQYIEAIDASTAPRPYYFLVQTLIPGKTLEDMLNEGYVFSSADISAIALAILPILSQMRAFIPPIVHRDIKPSNLMLTPSGHVYLIDFGASMLHERALGGTTVAGTAGYMSPEQCIGASSPESDIYSLGATLVHLLTAKPPWQLTLTSDMHLLFKSYLPLDTPTSLSQLLEAMLDPMPDKRLSDLPRLLRFLRADGNAENSSLFAKAPRSIANNDFNDTKEKSQKPKKKAELAAALFPDPLFENSWRIHMAWFFALFFFPILSFNKTEMTILEHLKSCGLVCFLCLVINIIIFIVYSKMYSKYNRELYQQLKQKNEQK